MEKRTVRKLKDGILVLSNVSAESRIKSNLTIPGKEPLRFKQHLKGQEYLVYIGDVETSINLKDASYEIY